MKFTFSFVFFFVIVFASRSQICNAQIPRTISYQGVLANPDGSFINDGNHALTLNLYLNSTGGTSIYSEQQTIPVVHGIFNAIIGSVTAIPASLAFDRAYFLGVSVDGGSEMSPRTALASVPYALYASHAGIADAVGANVKGVVSSINEVDGAIRLVGAGGTTVSNAGAVFTISSTTGGSGNGFSLPYSDSASNGSKPIFNVANTGSNGNTISGIGGQGSSISGMTTSAVFGDGGTGYNGVTGFSNGGSNSFAGVIGRATGNANGIMAIATLGDGISAVSGSARAGFFQSSGIANTIDALNSGSGEAVKGTSSNIGVHGLSSAATGILGETQSAAGIGVDAKYTGGGIGTALQIDNGAIKVSGQVKAAFIHTATLANIWGPSNAATEINNPLCNGDSIAMVFITHCAPASPSLPSYTS